MENRAIQFDDCERQEQSETPEKLRGVWQQLATDAKAAKNILSKTGMYYKNGKLKKEFR